MRGYQILLKYRGGLEKFPHISIAEVLENRILDDFMRDRLVFTGAKAPSLNDNYATPYNSALLIPTELIPGVVIHANLTSQIISAALENRPMLRAIAKPLNWLWIIFWSGCSATLGDMFLRQHPEIEPIKTSIGDIYPARGIIKTKAGQVILTTYPTDNINIRTLHISANCS